ncbi:hypothetical protein AaE_000559 [Aphanomyces astaci]|uniref:Uncharacterized protein n=1 Tax=Aphanomyces astaci TaxID=112090 RepID=A0A6A5AZ51_APHAT|nr:hypothetical protein AaE_000559 [Aphanomyces astaci]
MSDLHGTVHSLTTKYSRAQDEILGKKQKRCSDHVHIYKLRNSIVTLEDKAGGVDINADRRTIEHLTREVQELMAYRVAHDKVRLLFTSVCVLPPQPKGPLFDEASWVAKVMAEWRTHLPECISTSDAVDITTISGLVQDARHCIKCKPHIAPARYLNRLILVPMPPPWKSSYNAARLPVSSSPIKPTTATTTATPATTTSIAAIRDIAHSVFLTGLQEERNEGVDTLMQPETIVGDVFVGKGTGDAVPDYLHYDGYIRNKFYSKRDTERLIRY